MSNFKQDIINDIVTQVDTMQARRKKDAVDAILVKYVENRLKKIVDSENVEVQNEIQVLNGLKENFELVVDEEEVDIKVSATNFTMN